MFTLSGKASGAERDDAPLFDRRSFLILGSLAAAALLAGCSGSDDDLLLIDSSENDADGLGTSADFSPAVSLLDSISDDFGSFTLTSSSAPTIPSETLEEIESALSQVEQQASAGFLLCDLESGFGICSNIDEAVYGASTFKAPYALYLCEDVQENGLAELSQTDRELIESAILYSDNDAYVTLRDKYDSLDFDAWVTALGADDAVYRADSHYPWYCVRSAAKLWTEMLLYIQTGSDLALWLEELLNATETSFFRLALQDLDATFWSKAGWCAGSTSIYDSISESGIVECDGHLYLLSVMTGLHYDDREIDPYYRLVEAVFDARDCLNA